MMAGLSTTKAAEIFGRGLRSCLPPTRQATSCIPLFVDTLVRLIERPLFTQIEIQGASSLPRLSSSEFGVEGRDDRAREGSSFLALTAQG
jgi:hypothetical protein